MWLTVWGRAVRTLPTSIKEKETHWLKIAVILLHYKATDLKVFEGDLEGYWKHLAPGPGCEKYFCWQIGCLHSLPAVVIVARGKKGTSSVKKEHLSWIKALHASTGSLQKEQCS
eukprot:1161670-Pelagomonas_calceolata.AAC.30